MPDGPGAAGTPDAQDFAAMQPAEQAPVQTGGLQPAPPEAARPEAMPAVRLAPPSSTGLGDAVLSSLRRFGRAVQTLETIGSEWKQPSSATARGASALARGPAAARLAMPGNPPSAAQGTSPNPQAQTAVDQASNLFREGMEDQARMYGVAFEFGLVEASMESVNKALKSLLTQGGG